MSKRFPVVEVVGVFLVIGFVAGGTVPNFVRLNRRAKELEVKQNIVTIQKAIERYGVDKGTYPILILGGDITDSWVLKEDDYARFSGYPHTRKRLPAPEDFPGDVLLRKGYIGVYPTNPFAPRGVPRGVIPRLSLVYHNGEDRNAGGYDGTNVYDVLGGPPQFGGSVFAPQLYEDYNKNGYPEGQFKLSRYQAGNFYYYGRPEGGEAFVDRKERRITTYRLVAFGSPTSLGLDAYDIFGEFVETVRMPDSLKRKALNWPKGKENLLLDYLAVNSEKLTRVFKELSEKSAQAKGKATGREDQVKGRSEGNPLKTTDTKNKGGNESKSQEDEPSSKGSSKANTLELWQSLLASTNAVAQTLRYLDDPEISAFLEDRFFGGGSDGRPDGIILIIDGRLEAGN